MGMLVMRMLWLTPTLLGPKSSEVMETAAANIKPELRPMRAVPAWSAITLVVDASKKKAIGVGKRAMASHPVLAKYIFLHRNSFLVNDIFIGFIIYINELYILRMYDPTMHQV